MKPRKQFFLVLICAFLVVPATSDDISGKEKILCTTVRTTECYAEGGCLAGTPENWNLPRFMRVDLAEMRLSTTEASGESRTTSIQEIEHEGDDLLAYGHQQGRAFSFVLDKESGSASIAIALDGSVLAAFAVCTPLE